jgi:hypothetical protein
MFLFSFQICLNIVQFQSFQKKLFQNPTKMAGRLTLQERAQIAARYEVWGCIVQVQRWWRTIKGKHAQIDPKTIKNCHKKLMTTGSVADTQRSGRPSKSRDCGSFHSSRYHECRKVPRYVER